jgi:hypothetical protein
MWMRDDQAQISLRSQVHLQNQFWSPDKQSELDDFLVVCFNNCWMYIFTIQSSEMHWDSWEETFCLMASCFTSTVAVPLRDRKSCKYQFKGGCRQAFVHREEQRLAEVYKIINRTHKYAQSTKLSIELTNMHSLQNSRTLFIVQPNTDYMYLF